MTICVGLTAFVGGTVVGMIICIGMAALVGGRVGMGVIII